jgi:hypothetical protein
MSIDLIRQTNSSNRRFTFKKQKFFSIILFALLGLLLAVTQILGQSPDYSEYNDFFDLVRSEGLDVLAISRFEPGFSILALGLTTLFTTNLIVYGWIVIATMLLKGWLINVYSSGQKVFFVVAIFYITRYFSLHELTQLRAACAISLIMVGTFYLWKGNFLFGTFICTSALLFHMSAAAVIPALFIATSKRWQAMLIALIVFVFTFVFSGILTGYLGNFIQMINAYQAGGFGAEKPNPYAIQLLIDWAMIAASVIMWNKLSFLMKRIVLLEMIGMVIFYGAIDFAITAHRIREFYSVFWIFFVADGLRHKSTKLLTCSFVIISIFFYSYVFVASDTFFH